MNFFPEAAPTKPRPSLEIVRRSKPTEPCCDVWQADRTAVQPRAIIHDAAKPQPLPLLHRMEETAGERSPRNHSRIEPLNRPLRERRRKSGAKDARTPNAAASSGRPAPARSVWSACVFSAAL